MRANWITTVFWFTGWACIALAGFGALATFIGDTHPGDLAAAFGALLIALVSGAAFMAVAQALDCLNAMTRSAADQAATLREISEKLSGR